MGICFCAFTGYCDCRSLSHFCLRLPSLTTRQVHSSCSLEQKMFAGSCRYAALWSLACVVLIHHGRTLPTSESRMHSCAMLRSRLYTGANFRVCQMSACGHIFLVYSKTRHSLPNQTCKAVVKWLFREEVGRKGVSLLALNIPLPSPTHSGLQLQCRLLPARLHRPLQLQQHPPQLQILWRLHRICNWL